MQHELYCIRMCVQKYIEETCDDDIASKKERVEMERNPAYVPIEMNQIEEKPTYVNF